MTITLNGTTGITTPSLTSDAGITADGISFADGTPSNTLVTTTGGNVGIGTSSPTAKLEVSNAGTGTIKYTNSSSSISTYIGANSSNAYIGTPSNTAVAFTTNDTERMRIDSSGNLLVGTTSSTGQKLQVVPSGGAAAMRLQVSANGSGAIDWYNASAGYVASVIVNSSSVAYNTTSDYRLKENISPMTGALAKVSALKPCTYTWKSTGESSQGFIAHELQAVVPECVTGEKDAVDAEGNPEYQGIDTSFLVATLTAAIQELKAELDTVKTELATLKGTA